MKKGTPFDSSHFRSPTKGKKIHRNGLTRKQRRLKRNTHVNRYGGSNER
jgi:hypothetical protein